MGWVHSPLYAESLSMPVGYSLFLLPQQLLATAGFSLKYTLLTSLMGKW